MFDRAGSFYNSSICDELYAGHERSQNYTKDSSLIRFCRNYARHGSITHFIRFVLRFMFLFYLFYFTRLFLSANDFSMFLLPLDVKLSISDSSQSRICVRDLYRIGNQSALQKNDINAGDMSGFCLFFLTKSPSCVLCSRGIFIFYFLSYLYILLFAER